MQTLKSTTTPRNVSASLMHTATQIFSAEAITPQKRIDLVRFMYRVLCRNKVIRGRHCFNIRCRTTNQSLLFSQGKVVLDGKHELELKVILPYGQEGYRKMVHLILRDHPDFLVRPVTDLSLIGINKYAYVA